MSRFKKGYSESKDENEPEIVEYLQKHGYYVQTGHDDILVYHKYDGYDTITQIEIKSRSPFQKNGTIEIGFIKDSQYELLANANESYVIVWTKEQALLYVQAMECNDMITPWSMRKNYKDWLTDKEIKRLNKKGIYFNCQ